MKRAIGIVRVSRLGDDGVSPEIQAERIEAACERDGLRLLCTHRELDVSGGRPLARRPGLRAAVASIEAGEADVIVVAYFDRLMRSLKVQQEVVDRVEAAGGEVLTLDVGKLTNGSAAERLTGNFLGAVAQFVREQSAEKSAAAQERAIARGVHIGPVPLGYQRGSDKRLEPDPSLAPLVEQAYERRADGASAAEIRAWLAAQGVSRTVAGVRSLLANRTYLGEVHFGQWSKTDAHPALVRRELFDRVQRARASAGRKGKSERLLARQGILRCGACDGRMVVCGGTRGAFYRCGNDTCLTRATIYAEPVERKVLAALSDHLAGASTIASAGARVAELDAAIDAAQDELDSAIRVYTAAGVLGEPAAVGRLAELRAARDTAIGARTELGNAPAARIYGGREIVARGKTAEIRELLRAVGCRATVAPGRVADRLRIEFVQPAADPV